jgi:RNA polymerase sigma factor (sigma-70 family)
VDGDLDRWQALHEAAESLPADQREVFGLRFYHGWSNDEVAHTLNVSTKTVTRLWDRATVALRTRLGGRPLPEGVEPLP